MSKWENEAVLLDGLRKNTPGMLQHLFGGHIRSVFDPSKATFGQTKVIAADVHHVEAQIILSIEGSISEVAQTIRNNKLLLTKENILKIMVAAIQRMHMLGMARIDITAAAMAFYSVLPKDRLGMDMLMTAIETLDTDDK